MSTLHIHTPLIRSDVFSRRLGCDVRLKLDCLQPSGSFKIRGIGLTCQKAVESGAGQLVSSSGGNAGLAVAYAGRQLKVPVTVIVPETTSAAVQAKMRAEGATVIVHGAAWDEADAYARNLAESEGGAYVHPFAQPSTWQGHSSLVGELKQDLGDVKPSAIFVSVGGGGLLMGVLQGLAEIGWGDVTVVACETKGADSFAQSFQQKTLVTLPRIESLATTLGAKTISGAVLDAALKWPTLHSVVMADKDCVDALSRFADEHRLLVEPACAASLTPFYFPELLTAAGGKAFDAFTGPVVGIVCGGNGVNLATLANWRQQLGLEA